MAVRYKYCAVPMCQSSTVNSPDKKFITIPRDVTRRKKWFTAMGRYKPLADKTTGYCCCDHFDLPNDVENYIRWSLMPNTHVILKQGVLPHKFECQVPRVVTQPHRRAHNTLVLKKRRKPFFMEVLQGDIKDVEVKEEVEDFVHVPESQSSNLILQDIQPILDIKEEPIDDSVKIEEGCVSEMKLEDEDRPPSQEIETVYLNESNHIVVSPTIYCFECKKNYEDFCPKCPMLICIFDTMVKDDTPNRAFKTLPYKLLRLELGENSGVFAKRLIPAGITFGPFEGLKDIKIHEGRYFFAVKNRQIACTNSYDNSNWLQFIRYSSNLSATNLVMIQSKGRLFYRTRIPIQEGEQLLVLTADFSLNMVYFAPIKVDKIGPVYPCLMCCLGFSTRIYLRRHLKKCPYSGVSMFKILEETSRIESVPQLLPLTEKPVPKVPDGANVSLQDTLTYICRLCNRQINGLNNFKHHSNRTHNIGDDLNNTNQDVKQCDACNAIFDTQSEYIIHRRSHIDTLNNLTNSNALQCKICNKTFEEKQLLSQHIQIHMTKTPDIRSGRLRCAKCPKTFMKMKTYRSHMILHKLIKENKALKMKVTCMECSKSFPNKIELNKHADKHHSKKKKSPELFKCSYCDLYSDKKCIDFVQHMLHKYDKAPSVPPTT